MIKVFVYGTLRKGQIRHFVLENSLFIGQGLLRGYDMYDLGNFPAIVRGNGVVHGEVYQIDENTLSKLDLIEGVGFGLYNREIKSIELYNGEKTEAHVYVYNGIPNKVTLITSGDWVKYTAKYKNTTNIDREKKMSICKEEKREEILYAAYGSNMLKERFLVYIIGSKNYRGKTYDGCKDKTEPVDYGIMRVPYRLYFAKKSSRWNYGGVAFLSCEPTDNTDLYAVVRLWKISKSQFFDIQRQEGGWYSKIIDLGEKDNLKIRTFTGCFENEINMPSKEYLEIIKLGLKECTGWDDKKIEEYISISLRKR